MKLKQIYLRTSLNLPSLSNENDSCVSKMKKDVISVLFE